VLTQVIGDTLLFCRITKICRVESGEPEREDGKMPGGTRRVGDSGFHLGVKVFLFFLG